jgi:hypothetical protein
MIVKTHAYSPAIVGEIGGAVKMHTIYYYSKNML